MDIPLEKTKQVCFQTIITASNFQSCLNGCSSQKEPTMAVHSKPFLHWILGYTMYIIVSEILQDAKVININIKELNAYTDTSFI